MKAVEENGTKTEILFPFYSPNQTLFFIYIERSPYEKDPFPASIASSVLISGLLRGKDVSVRLHRSVRLRYGIGGRFFFVFKDEGSPSDGEIAWDSSVASKVARAKDGYSVWSAYAYLSFVLNGVSGVTDGFYYKKKKG